ncbi:helix-turn-helix domain-containing protein [Corynebacterium vitaeruminis]
MALEHIANGASASAVGRDLGIPSPTVRRWARTSRRSSPSLTK